MRSTVGNYRTENIVTRGLVLHLDAGNPNSYYGPSNSTVWKDLSGNANNGTLVNGPTFNDRAFVFDGVDDYVDCGDILPLGFQNFTINIWIYRRDGIVGEYIFSKGSAAAGVAGSSFYMVNGSTYVRFSATDSTPTRSSNIEHSGITTNQWYNFSYTYDGFTLSGYRDGSNLKTNTSILGPILYINQPIKIGTHTYGSACPQMDVGFFSIYNRALSPTEIQQNYNALKSRYGL